MYSWSGRPAIIASVAHIAFPAFPDGIPSGLLPLRGEGRDFPYILSGTSMPSSAIPFLMTFATFFAKTSRVIFSASVSALRML